MLSAISSSVLKYLLGGSLIISLLLGGALAWSQHELGNAKEVIQGLVEWQDGVTEATRLAAGSPDPIKPKDVLPLIQNLGLVRAQLIEAVEDQNKAIEAIEQEAQAAMQVAERARKERAKAIQRVELLQAELRERAGNPVDPALMEEEIRRSQDKVYEAGL